MTDRIDELSPRARWFLENFDEIDLADICASNEAAGMKAQASLERLRTRVQAAADEARGSVRGWLVDALADLDDPRQPSTAADTCADGCRGVTGIRGLLEHVGIDTSGGNINVAGKVVDVAPDGGPTVAEAAADDEAHWTTKYAGEGS